jgi:pimeloyl-ACP methyl ester carboxylesterase
MSTITTKDGTQLYYRDWGKGPPVVFSHGWPLTGDAFEDQMFFLASHGYRCIAHDRRGHGRSSQPWNGNDMDTYADDLAELVQKLDLEDAIHVGHSTGGGEVARYVARHGTERVAKVVLIGAVPPLMLKTPANIGGLPIDVFDQIRAGVVADRSQFFMDLDKRLAAGPVVTVPTITMEGDANGAPHPEPASYAKKFSGKYSHRTATGGIGHNLPQEAPQAFAQAVVDVDGY